MNETRHYDDSIVAKKLASKLPVVIMKHCWESLFIGTPCVYETINGAKGGRRKVRQKATQNAFT